MKGNFYRISKNLILTFRLFLYPRSTTTDKTKVLDTFLGSNTRTKHFPPHSGRPADSTLLNSNRHRVTQPQASHRGLACIQYVWSCCRRRVLASAKLRRAVGSVFVCASQTLETCPAPQFCPELCCGRKETTEMSKSSFSRFLKKSLISCHNLLDLCTMLVTCSLKRACD